jgi:uncharacterized protein YlxW (UPF0749 family)
MLEIEIPPPLSAQLIADVERLQKELEEAKEEIERYKKTISFYESSKEERASDHSTSQS